MADKHLFNDTVNLGVHTPHKNMRDTVEIQYLAEIDLLMVNKIVYICNLFRRRISSLYYNNLVNGKR